MTDQDQPTPDDKPKRLRPLAAQPQGDGDRQGLSGQGTPPASKAGQEVKPKPGRWGREYVPPTDQ